MKVVYLGILVSLLLTACDPKPPKFISKCFKDEVTLSYECWGTNVGGIYTGNGCGYYPRRECLESKIIPNPEYQAWEIRQNKSK